MRRINIFVAGAKLGIEEERKRIKEQAYSLQILEEWRNYFVIQTLSFEDFPTHLDAESHQQAYNNFIKNEADIVFFVFRGHVGDITVQEFDAAYNAYLKNRHPRVYVLSYLCDGISSFSDHPLAEKLRMLGRKGIYYEEYKDFIDFEKRVNLDIGNYLKYLAPRPRPKLSLRKVLSYIILTILILCGVVAYKIAREIKFYGSLSTYEELVSYKQSQRLLKSIYDDCVVYKLNRIDSLCRDMNERYNCNLLQSEMSEYRLKVLDDLLRNMVPVSAAGLDVDMFVGKYEVTELEYDLPKVYREGNDGVPKSNISYNDCALYIKRLNILTGLKFRIPTIEEWEYLARAGENTDYSGSNDCNLVAWYQNNSGGIKHYRNDEHSYLKCNSFDLYDMSGNLSEWCLDSTVFNGHVSYAVKGGNYMSDVTQLKISFTDWLPKDFSGPTIGFRLIRD